MRSGLFPWKRLVKTLNKLLFTVHECRRMAFVVSEKRLLEAWVVPDETSETLETIYVGKVKNIRKNLNAAFVEYRPGILGFFNLTESERFCGGKLCAGDEIPVQLKRMEIKSKRAALTSKLELSGEFVIVQRDAAFFGISSKIKDGDFRREIRSRFESLKPECRPFGVLIRTNAYEVGWEAVFAEYSELSEKLSGILKAAETRRSGSVLYRPSGFAEQLLKNANLAQTEEIVTDLPDIYRELSGNGRIPVRLYEDDRLSLSALYHIPAAFARATGKKVWLPSGGYLVIEPTEAMTVIDVNSGKNNGQQKHEELCLTTNLEAAEEIALQLRLRNCSGMILIDFINMKDQAASDQLLFAFRGELAKDPVRTHLVDITGLGLVEVTRQKIRAPLWEQLGENGSNGV